jgi:hypothetical protein
MFQSIQSRVEADVLYRELDYWNDCLHPRLLNRTIFLTHGVASVLGANGQQTIEKIGLKETLEKFLSADEKYEKFFQLIHDPNLMENGTASFLGGDRAEILSTILEAKDVQALSSSNIKDAVRQALEKLKANPQDGASWATIRTVIWDLPVYQDLQADLKDVIKDLDWDALISSDLNGATYAMMVASSQLPYYPDAEVRAGLEVGLLSLLRRYSDNWEREGEDDQTDRNVAVLLECALGLAIEIKDARASSKSWGRLLLQMLNVAPCIARYLGYAMFKRVFEAPAAQLHGLFPVLLAVRAVSKEPV